MTPWEERQLELGSVSAISVDRLRDTCVGLAQLLSNAVTDAALAEQKPKPQLRQIPASWRLRIDPKRARRAA